MSEDEKDRLVKLTNDMMSYKEQYPDAKFKQLVTNGVIKWRTAKPCVTCKHPTEFMLLDLQVFVCSEFCTNRHINSVTEKEL